MIPFLADLFGSTSGVAAVYGQQDAGDVPGVIAREKQRRGSAILRTYHLPVGLEARGIRRSACRASSQHGSLHLEIDDRVPVEAKRTADLVGVLAEFRARRDRPGALVYR